MNGSQLDRSREIFITCTRRRLAQWLIVLTEAREFVYRILVGFFSGLPGLIKIFGGVFLFRIYSTEKEWKELIILNRYTAGGEMLQKQCHLKILIEKYMQKCVIRVCTHT